MGDGIQITLDGLGCLIPARQGRDDRYTERAAKLPTVDEVPGKAGGGGKKFKTLLSNVRRRLLLLFLLLLSLDPP